ncbi:HEPN domain-containing protein [uncultured Dysosmobacter sp.]
MSNLGKSEYWIRSAEYDLQTARTMLETRRLLYMGFICHQTIKRL